MRHWRRETQRGRAKAIVGETGRLGASVVVIAAAVHRCSPVLLLPSSSIAPTPPSPVCYTTHGPGLLLSSANGCTISVFRSLFLKAFPRSIIDLYQSKATGRLVRIFSDRVQDIHAMAPGCSFSNVMCTPKWHVDHNCGEASICYDRFDTADRNSGQSWRRHSIWHRGFLLCSGCV